METHIIDLTSPEPDWSLLGPAIRSLQKGEVVAFPTETVYGLGGNALSSSAVDRIYEAKGRPSDNPLIVHIGERSQLDGLVSAIPEIAHPLIDSFWPGPLTLLFHKKEIVPDRTTGGLSTVAIRMPAHPVALALLRESMIPLAAPSANLSGKPSPTTAQHVFQDLSGAIPYIIDGGSCRVGVESTILDVTTTPATLLRPGGVTREEIENVIGPIELDPSLEKNQGGLSRPKAPGMKYKHYSPRAAVVLIEGKQPQDAIRSFCAQHASSQIMGIVTPSLSSLFDSSFRFISSDDLAHHLFSFFREADSRKAEYILIAGVSEEGIGFSVMNRIRKAATCTISEKDGERK